MVAKEKNWDQTKINKMLTDRDAFEKEFNVFMRYKEKQHLPSDQIFDPVANRLHAEAMDKKVRLIRA